MKNYRTLLLLTASIALTGCQTVTTVPSQDRSKYDNTVTLKADIPDSDSDGVLDDIDECPETPNHIVVDSKGCPTIVYAGGLEMELNGFFLPMSSQLPDIYDVEFVKVAENLNDYPKAKVFVFGHMASNELGILHNKNNLSRNRAINVKNRLVKKHNIASDRISTYDCSDRYLFIDTDFRASDFENIESKDRRVSVKASTQVNNLANLEYASDRKNYERYSKHCELFE